MDHNFSGKILTPPSIAALDNIWLLVGDVMIIIINKAKILANYPQQNQYHPTVISNRGSMKS
jgi:hypothetical protein